MTMKKSTQQAVAVGAVVLAALAYVIWAPAPKPVPALTGQPSTGTPAAPAPTSIAPAPSGSAPAATPKPATGKISLSARLDTQGILLTWTVAKGFSTPNGFEILRGVGANPTFPLSTNEFVPEPTGRSYLWQGKDGMPYHFRICAWNGKTGSQAGCLAYSNDVAATAPGQNQGLNAGTAYQPVSGQLVVTAAYATSGVSIHWTAATATNFTTYQVVRSLDNPDPYWPRDGSIYSTGMRAYTSYLDAGAAKGKTYYYRVCAQLKSGLPICGNTTKVTLPSPY